MAIRTVYASFMTVFALLVGFYALMTLAFFFGEGRSERIFPLFITAASIIIVWTAIDLWRGKDALILTGVGAILIAGITGWIVVPAHFVFEPAFIVLILTFLIGLGLLVGLLFGGVRESLRN